MTPVEFTDALLLYCQGTHASVTSWYRTRAHNAAVGGVDRSPHCYGLGADVVYDPGGDQAQRATLAAELGLHRIIERDHDHLQPPGWTRPSL